MSNSARAAMARPSRSAARARAPPPRGRGRRHGRGPPLRGPVRRAGAREGRVGRRDQEGVPRVGAALAPRQERGRRGGARAVPGHQQGVRRAFRPDETRVLRPDGRRGGHRRQRGRLRAYVRGDDGRPARRRDDRGHAGRPGRRRLRVHAPVPVPEAPVPPRRAFPENMRFSEAFPVPPAVAELVEREAREALQRLVSERKAKTNARRGGDDARLGLESVLRAGDDDLVFARASDRDRGAGTSVGGGGERRGGLGRRSAEDLDAEELDDEDLGDPELRRCCARCLPRCSSSSCARTRAPAARRARRAAALVALLEEMGMQESGLPPESPGPWGRARGGGGGGGGGRFGEARSARGSGAARRAPARGAGAGAARARGARALGTRARARSAAGKRVGLPGPGRRRRTARARFSTPRRARAGRKIFLFLRSPKRISGPPPGSTPGSRTEKNRRKKARKKTKEKEKDTEKDTEKEGSVHEGSVTREMHEDADGPTSNAAEGRVGARRVLRATTRRRDGLGQQRRRAFDRRGRSKGRPRSFAALGRRSESRGRRRLARRTRDVRGRARRVHGSRPRNRRSTRARTPVTRDRPHGVALERVERHRRARRDGVVARCLSR